MSASLVSALAAAQAAAASQHYPQGTLYVVATPIGNLCDITLRALHVLALADAIACEDTRHTQTLLRAYGIDKPSTQLLAVHQHNEAQAAQGVIVRLQQGQRLAYVSDAGTPAVSDPGARLVAGVRDAGLAVVPIPGASSVTAALSVAGITQDSGFVFAGFLPTKSAERERAVLALAGESRAVVLLESPHRMAAVAQALTTLGPRPVTVARELTKQFEEIHTLVASDLVNWLQAQPQRLRGEFVLVLHPVTASIDTGAEERTLRLLLAELPLKSAVRLAAEISGASRNALYQRALAIKGASHQEADRGNGSDDQ